jgi:hypothetical protein
MARAFNKPGTILMGSTFEKNVSYADHFRIIRKENRSPKYNPIRIPGVDAEFTDRLNDGIMMFTEKELDKIIETVNKDIHEK